MSFIKREDNVNDLYVTLQDVEVLNGTFTKGTILRRIGSDPIRGLNFIDCEGNKLLETRFIIKNIVPLSSAYKLFEPKKREK